MLFRIIITITITIAFALSSCRKIKYYPDKDYKEIKTMILAHKAGGGGTSVYQEYSIDAAKNSMSVLDGIEVDLQISKDRTVWLLHNAELPACGGVFYNCFPEETDDQIVKLDTCDGNGTNYFRLEEIFALLSSSYPDKYISLDVKSWEPCASTSLNVPGVMNVIADEIIRLTNKYNLHYHIMVESETASFLTYLKNNSMGIDCYLTSLGDFERAMQLSLQAGYAGISFKYKFDEEISMEHVQLLRRKGLKIQLWTVNEPESINEALSINPDFIQTDNIDYIRQLTRGAGY